MTRRAAQFILIQLFVAISWMWAQDLPLPEEIVNVTAITEQNAVTINQPVRIALELSLRSGWHIYAPVAGESFTIPTSIEVDSIVGGTLGQWVFPAAQQLSVSGVDEPAAVYSHKITLYNTLTVTAFGIQTFTLTGSVHYQACNDQTCLIPASVPFSLTWRIVPPGTGIEKQNAAVFASRGHSTAPTLNSDQANSPISGENNIAGLVSEKGLLLTFIIIFFIGLTLNLTPCVYPLIPITISFFGGTGVSRGKIFWSALAYVLGIAITYSILGVIAASTGSLFGKLLTNPLVLIGIASLLVALSLSMFGVYEFRLPTGLMTAAGKSKSVILGSLFMGLTLGIVAAPCVGPFVIGLLTYVAQLQDVVLGFWMFFVLALGLGLPYLFLAVFSSKISRLPRSGAWMVGVRVIFGLLLIGMAIYFLLPLLGNVGGWLFSGFIFLAGFWLIVVDQNGKDARGFLILKQIIGIAVIVIATYLLVSRSSGVASEAINWQRPTTETQFDKLVQTGRPVLIDFYADWCIPCREMDQFTFTDRRVIEKVKLFTPIKIDLTTGTSALEQALQSRYAVKGVPTYIFLNRSGTEYANLRLTGLEWADAFVKRLDAAAN